LSLYKEYFKANQLSINFNKTHSIQFAASNNNPLTDIKVAYDRKQITFLSNIKYLGIYINDKMSGKQHIEQISAKLNVVCYIIRTIKPYTSINNLKLFVTLTLITNYGLPLWANSPHCINIFRILNNFFTAVLLAL
jgi:hypothetical protein